MSDGHWVRKKGGGWIISVPREVRRYLKVTHRMRLYWHCARLGEAALTVSEQRKAGRPEVTRLTRDLAAARDEIEAIQRRDQYRDRALYAEGYAHGYASACELMRRSPDGSAERAHRRARRVWSGVAGVARSEVAPSAALLQPSRPRFKSRRRRSEQENRRAEEVAPRAVEIAGSIDGVEGDTAVAPPSVNVDPGSS